MSILVTGAAGFIGSHLCHALLDRGEHVIGLDNLNDYYSVQLKRDRLERLADKTAFEFHTVDLTDKAALESVFSSGKVKNIIHLAAQAGVRYSIENPAAYVNSNLIGHSNMLEMARHYGAQTMLYASSSSIYGGNQKTPFAETDPTDDPVSFYGATKKSNELMSNAYARLYSIPLIGLRFFTVYGPWGRPDMAYWIFSQKIKQGQPIQVFNQGNMRRDFTYIDDIIAGVLAALDRPLDRLGLAVPHRVYNLGNDQPERLNDLISHVESAMGTAAKKEFMPMQQGDVKATWADISRARGELDYAPKTSLKDGIENFARWYHDHWQRYI